MNKLTFLIASAFFALLLTAIGCSRIENAKQLGHVGDSPSQSSVASKAKVLDPQASVAPKVIISTASWAQVYDLNELTRAADLIVEGTINGALQTRSLHPNDTTTIFTDFTLDISKVLKSYPRFGEKSITVIQYGGTLQNTTRMMEGNDLFQTGEQVLLFLQDASDDPVQSAKGEIKFSLLMPGGRFTIKEGGQVENPTKDSLVADKFDGATLSVLENSITSALPDASTYLTKAATASLIVEGIVGDADVRLVESEDTQSVYTVYPFQVQNIIFDDMLLAESAGRKPGEYQHSPVQVGEKISVFERGGTFQDITQRWAWSWNLKPGTRMVLFLGIMNCGEKPVLCTQEEMQSATAPYFAGGGARFIVNADNSLTATTRDFLSHLYDGEPIENLTRDVVEARARIQKELEAKTQGASNESSMPPPPTETK